MVFFSAACLGNTFHSTGTRQVMTDGFSILFLFLISMRRNPRVSCGFVLLGLMDYASLVKQWVTNSILLWINISDASGMSDVIDGLDFK